MTREKLFNAYTIYRRYGESRRRGRPLWEVGYEYGKTLFMLSIHISERQKPRADYWSELISMVLRIKIRVS